MKLKLLLISVTYVTTSILLALFQSCDVLRYDAYVCDIQFTGLTSNFNPTPPDTLVNNVGFRIIADEALRCYRLPSFNLISTCYATTKAPRWKNKIVTSSFKLSFDKQVVLFGDTIYADTDLFQISNFADGIEITEEHHGPYDDSLKTAIEYQINFSSSLLDSLTFENGIYNSSFSYSTDDSRTFTKQRAVVFNP